MILLFRLFAHALGYHDWVEERSGLLYTERSCRLCPRHEVRLR